jgi:hypothetical protein
VLVREVNAATELVQGQLRANRKLEERSSSEEQLSTVRTEEDRVIEEEERARRVHSDLNC